MTIIIDFAKYQNARGISAPAIDAISPDACETRIDNDAVAVADIPIGLRAAIPLCWSVIGWMLEAVLYSNNRDSLDELSPHLKRDIGLIDYSQKIRGNF